MKKRVLVVVILQLLFIIMCGAIVKNVAQREVLLRNLKSIETEFLYVDNFYERTKEKANEDNYHEIRESWKHLASSIGNFRCTSEMIVTPNTAKIIDSMHHTFLEIADSNVISEKNAKLYYDKINEIIVVIKNSTKDIKFKDISNQSYEQIHNILKDLENINLEELRK